MSERWRRVFGGGRREIDGGKEETCERNGEEDINDDERERCVK